MTDTEIVRALAEKVMGWHKAEGGERSAGWLLRTVPKCAKLVACPNWNPLTDDGAACHVLDKLAEQGHEPSFT